MTHILVVDNRADIRMSLSLLLESHHYQIVEADNPQTAQLKLKEQKISLIILDMNGHLDATTEQESLRFLAWLKSNNISIPVIIMSTWHNVELVKQAIQLGVKNIIEKPWRNQQLLHMVEQQLSLASLQLENDKFKQQLKPSTAELYQWRSACMLQLQDEIKALTNSKANILLTGDSGSGKSEFARQIHQQCSEKQHAWVAVDVAAIDHSLFDKEMFGDNISTFTEKQNQHLGYLSLADQGTLFVHGIELLPLNHQKKFLQTIINNEPKTSNTSYSHDINCRIISSTNVDLSSLMTNNKFHKDLYKCISAEILHLPPLQEREQDIIPLAQFFIAKFSQKYQCDYCELTQGAQQALCHYHWPGNIRELSQLVERAVLLNNNQAIDIEDLRLTANNPNVELPLMTLREAEINLIQKALLQTDNNIPKAAKILGLTKSSMYRRVEKYDLA